jgi:hypothetical protein
MNIGFDAPLYTIRRAAAINRRCAAGEKAVK